MLSTENDLGAPCHRTIIAFKARRQAKMREGTGDEQSGPPWGEFAGMGKKIQWRWADRGSVDFSVHSTTAKVAFRVALEHVGRVPLV